MKHILLTIVVVILGICFPSCSKTIDTSVSLSGTEWTQTFESKSTVELSFSDIEFSLTYTVHEKYGDWLPGEGYRIKGSYVYESPEANLYCRTIEFLFNEKVESVDTYKDEFTAVVVDDALSLYMENEPAGTFSRNK
jgi:hypothetical protein